MMKELILSLILIVSLVSVSQAFAQTGGPIVPNIPNTISQYCSSGSCITSPILGVPINYTHATKHLPIIFVSYSQTCETMIKNHIQGCSSLESLVPYDTSNQYISGHFIKQGNETIRGKAQVKNNWLYYEGRTNKTVCIECAADITIMQQSQQVIIQPTDFTFIDKNSNLVNKTWTSYQSRYMQGCDAATIANIPDLINDTIHYMLNNCSKTSFNGTNIHPVKQAVWSYDNPYSTLHLDTYLKSFLNGHSLFSGNHTAGGLGPTDCIRHTCNYKDPYAKVGWN